MKRMAELQLLTMPSCPHCSKCKKLVEKIKNDFPELKMKVINILKYPKLVEKYKIMSVPAVVIDGKLEFVGIPREDELRKKLKK